MNEFQDLDWSILDQDIDRNIASTWEDQKSKYSRTASAYDDVREVLRRIVPVLMALKRESQNHQTLLRHYVDENGDASTKSLIEIEKYPRLGKMPIDGGSGGADDPNYLQVLSRGCMEINVKDGRDVPGLYKMPGFTYRRQSEYPQPLQYMKNLNEGIQRILRIMFRKGPSYFKDVYRPWNAWWKSNKHEQKNKIFPDDMFTDELVKHRYLNIPADDVPIILQSNRVNKDIKMKTTETVNHNHILLVDVLMPSNILSNGKMKKINIPATISSNVSKFSVDMISGNGTGKRLTVFQNLASAARVFKGDPSSYKRDRYMYNAKDHIRDMIREYKSSLLELTGPDKHEMKFKGQAGLLDVNGLGDTMEKHFKSHDGEQQQAGDRSANMYRDDDVLGEWIPINDIKTDPLGLYVDDLTKDVDSLGIRCLKDLKKQYDNLARVEFFHRNLALSTADCMRMLNDVSDSFLFLLSKFGCDHWSEDASPQGYVEGVENLSGQADILPSEKLHKKIDGGLQEAKDYAALCLRRDPYVSLEIEYQGKNGERKIHAPRLNMEAYDKDVTTMRTVINRVLHAPNQYKHMDEESNDLMRSLLVNLEGSFEDENFMRPKANDVYRLLLWDNFVKKLSVQKPEQMFMYKMINFHIDYEKKMRDRMLKDKKVDDKKVKKKRDCMLETALHVFWNSASDPDGLEDLSDDLLEIKEIYKDNPELTEHFLKYAQTLLKEGKYRDCYIRNRIRRQRVFSPGAIGLWLRESISDVVTMLGSGKMDYDKNKQGKVIDMERNNSGRYAAGTHIEDRGVESETPFLSYPARKRNKKKGQEASGSDNSAGPDAMDIDVDDVFRPAYNIYRQLDALNDNLKVLYSNAGKPEIAFIVHKMAFELGDAKDAYQNYLHKPSVQQQQSAENEPRSLERSLGLLENAIGKANNPDAGDGVGQHMEKLKRPLPTADNEDPSSEEEESDDEEEESDNPMSSGDDDEEEESDNSMSSGYDEDERRSDKSLSSEEDNEGEDEDDL